MRELYTIELVRLVEELGSLEGYYIDQFYELGKGKFRIKLSRKGEKLNLRCMLPETINRTEYIELSEEATNFSMGIRKRISGLAIASIAQLNNDRIIMIKAGTGEKEANMIFEMFGRGNLVLADSSMKIQLAYQIHNFKDRAVRPNVTYQPPKNQSIGTLGRSEIDTAVKAVAKAKGGQDMLHALTKSLGVGSMYIEEAINRVDVAADSKPADMSGDQIIAVTESLISLVEECRKGSATAYMKGDKAVDFSLCQISKYKGLERKEFDSLEACLDFMYNSGYKPEATANKEAEGIRASIKKQTEILEGIDAEIAECKSSADYIMRHMHGVNSTISAIDESKKSKAEVKPPQGIEILSIDWKNKRARIRSNADW
ncbi:MAG: NFACT family protein [Candidatus Micrarchaeaceae archaeon]|jgi:predicted ribosome quality control (RQC) complex YloA/Tae2 family protein